MSSFDEWWLKWKLREPPKPVVVAIDSSKGSDWSMFQVLERGKVVSQLDLDVERAREEMERQALSSMGIPPSLLVQAETPFGKSVVERMLQEQRDRTYRQEYLGTFSPHDPGLAVDLPTDIQEEEEEWEVVARTATSTSTRRRRKTTPGRATVAGPTTKNDPIYTWGMQSSKPRNGGEYIQYEVRLNDDGSVTCNCPGWIFKKKTETRGCKHTRHETIVKDAPDFYQRHLRGEQLPTILPTNEQVARAMNTRAGKKAAETGKDMLQGFGRFIELED